MRCPVFLPATCLFAVVTLATSSCSQPATDAPSTDRRHVAVSLEGDGQVAIVDPSGGTVVARIAVGKRPRGVRTSPDGRHLYVALSGSPVSPPGTDPSTLPPADRSADGIGVIDLDKRTLLQTLDSGQDPETFDLSPDGQMLYVSNEETAEMTALDLTTGGVKGVVAVGEEPEGVAVRPDGKVVYVTCEGTNEVVAVDTASLRVVARVAMGARPRDIAFTPDGTRAYVTAEVGQTVAVVDAQQHTLVDEIAVTAPAGSPPPLPMGLALDMARNRLFVSTGRGQTVGVLDLASGSQVGTITSVGARPWGIALSADGRQLFTANGPSGDMSIIDAVAGQVVRRVPVGSRPWGVALVP